MLRFYNVGVKMSNINVSASLGISKLNLKYLQQKFPEMKLVSKGIQTHLVVSEGEDKIAIYSTGTIVATKAKTRQSGEAIITKYANFLADLQTDDDSIQGATDGETVIYMGQVKVPERFKIGSSQAISSTKFDILLEKVEQNYPFCTSLDADASGPFLVFRMLDMGGVVCTVTSSGGITITGAKSKELAEKAVENIFPILLKYRTNIPSQYKTSTRSKGSL